MDGVNPTLGYTADDQPLAIDLDRLIGSRGDGG